MKCQCVQGNASTVELSEGFSEGNRKAKGQPAEQQGCLHPRCPPAVCDAVGTEWGRQQASGCGWAMALSLGKMELGLSRS